MRSARLVEAAVGIGVEDVGIVGAKIVDRDDPRSLRDIGRSSDRFGHPSSSLQAGEIDQGQFDRVLEVLCVSSAAMLISREAVERTDLFDERLDPAASGSGLLLAHTRRRLSDLDDAARSGPSRRRSRRGEVAADRRCARSQRYEEDRAAIAAMLKNYSLLSLLWVVPAALVLGALRLVYLVLGRRFEEAFDVARHGAGTSPISRARWAGGGSAQKARRVRDRALRRFMESGRCPFAELVRDRRTDPRGAARDRRGRRR